MFFLMGINSKVKDLGPVAAGACPVCGRDGVLHLCNKYMTPHIFFIPTFRFHNSYLATCASCASVMEVAPDKGKSLERGQQIRLFPGDMRIVQDNAVPLCPGCGARLPRDSAFCNRCGHRL